MFGKRYDLVTVLGVTLRIDASWLIIAALITWGLASRYAGSYPEMGTAAHWILGLAGALGLFGSVVLHEFGHALMARQVGLSIRGITLFFFGGVAEMDSEPPSPLAEFLVAVAGPAVTIAVAVLCIGLGSVSFLSTGAGAATELFGYLGTINLLLLAFNMIPAFPLDGGRVLRSALWFWKKDLAWATSIASRIGRGFGFLLIALGIFDVVARQDLVGGVWMCLIGLFLRNAAQVSYQHVLIRDALEGTPVGRFARTEVALVPRAISVAEFVQEYVYRLRYELYPVVDNDKLVGCITTDQIQQLPQSEWSRQTVGSLAVPSSADNSIAPNLDAAAALNLMVRTGRSALMVVEDGHLVGIVTLRDLLEVSSLKRRLETPPSALTGSN